MKNLSIAIFSVLFLIACKEKQKSASQTDSVVKNQDSIAIEEDSTATYFSIKEYFADQWKTRNENPYTLLKIVEVNGKRDSNFLNLDNALWNQLVAPFADGDIGTRPFFGKYRFQEFGDESSESVHLYYQANYEDLFTQKMDVSADANSLKIKSVYMETNLDKDDHVVKRKLNYVPDRIFQYIDFEKSADGNIKNTLTEYHFNY